MTKTVPDPAPTRKKLSIGAAASSMVGTTIENYDFLAFGTAAATYFGTAFPAPRGRSAGRSSSPNAPFSSAITSSATVTGSSPSQQQT